MVRSLFPLVAGPQNLPIYCFIVPMHAKEHKSIIKIVHRRRGHLTMPPLTERRLSLKVLAFHFRRRIDRLGHQSLTVEVRAS